MTTRATDPSGAPAAVRARHASLARPWRWLLVAYAAAMTVGTHWPRLRLGTQEHPVSDKLIHTAAFGVLALLLWQARIVRSPAKLWLVGVAWAACDEITQGIPALGRTISGLDVLASATGVTLAAALLWALGPVGASGGAARRAHARLRWSVEEALAWPAGAAIVVVAAALGAAIAAPIGWFLADFLLMAWRIDGAMLASAIGAAAGLHLAIEARRRRALARGGAPCFECGGAGDGRRFDDDGLVACGACGAPLHAGQWRAPPSPRRATALGLVAGALVTALTVVAAMFGLWLVLLALRLRHALLASLDQSYNALSYDMRLVLDMLWLGLLAAATIRLIRRRFARLVDRQHLCCVVCGHDLRHTPLDRGCGVCGECGAGFVGIRRRAGPAPE